MSLLAEGTIAWPGGPRPLSLPSLHHPPPAQSRSPAEPWDPGARRRAGEVRAPACAGGFGCVKVTEEKAPSGVECLFIPKPAFPGPLGLAAGSVGKVQLVVGCGEWGWRE